MSDTDSDSTASLLDSLSLDNPRNFKERKLQHSDSVMENDKLFEKLLMDNAGTSKAKKLKPSEMEKHSLENAGKTKGSKLQTSEMEHDKLLLDKAKKLKSSKMEPLYSKLSLENYGTSTGRKLTTSEHEMENDKLFDKLLLGNVKSSKAKKLTTSKIDPSEMENEQLKRIDTILNIAQKSKERESLIVKHSLENDGKCKERESLLDKLSLENDGKCKEREPLIDKLSLENDGKCKEREPLLDKLSMENDGKQKTRKQKQSNLSKIEIESLLEFDDIIFENSGKSKGKNKKTKQSKKEKESLLEFDNILTGNAGMSKDNKTKESKISKESLLEVDDEFDNLLLENAGLSKKTNQLKIQKESRLKVDDQQTKVIAKESDENSTQNKTKDLIDLMLIKKNGQWKCSVCNETWPINDKKEAEYHIGTVHTVKKTKKSKIAKESLLKSDDLLLENDGTSKAKKTKQSKISTESILELDNLLLENTGTSKIKNTKQTKIATESDENSRQDSSQQQEATPSTPAQDKTKAMIDLMLVKKNGHWRCSICDKTWPINDKKEAESHMGTVHMVNLLMENAETSKYKKTKPSKESLLEIDNQSSVLSEDKIHTIQSKLLKFDDFLLENSGTSKAKKTKQTKISKESLLEFDDLFLENSGTSKVKKTKPSKIAKEWESLHEFDDLLRENDGMSKKRKKKPESKLKIKLDFSKKKPSKMEKELKNLKAKGDACTTFNPDKSDREKAKIARKLEQENMKAKEDTWATFNPDQSEREKAKMARKIAVAKEKKKIYDDKGHLVGSGLDLCDCLDDNCVGCHFPCPKCRSVKCGHECRQNRKWQYETVEIDGVPGSLKTNPHLVQSVKERASSSQ